MKLTLKNKKDGITFDLKKLLKNDYVNKTHNVQFSITISEDIIWLHEFKIISTEQQKVYNGEFLK
jgi:hypothetical protein